MAEGFDPQPSRRQSVGDDGASQSQPTHRGNQPTLVTAMEALFDVRAKWYNVGLCLGVDEGTLEAIRAQYTDPQDQLREMLRKWLTNPNVTWNLLIEALRHRIVEEINLANTLEQRYLLSPGLSHQDRQAVAIAERNLGIIKGRFASLLIDACTELQNNLSGDQIQIRKLRLFAISYFDNPPAIPESTEPHEIFEAISRNKLWDYWNYYPLQVIVEEFGGSASAMMSGRIEAYKRDLSGFQVATRIMHFVLATGSNRTQSMSRSDEPLSPEQRDPRYVSQLSWKLDEEVGDYSLDYLESLWKSFAHHSSLPPLPVLLDTVRRGCISVIWLIRPKLARQLMEKAGDLTSFFQKHPFLTVHIDGKCIYERQPTKQTKQEHVKQGQVRQEVDHLGLSPRMVIMAGHGWICSTCGYRNDDTCYNCEICNKPKSITSPFKVGVKHEKQEGDQLGLPPSKVVCLSTTKYEGKQQQLLERAGLMTLADKPKRTYTRRNIRCGQCVGCLTKEDCGECELCRDKPKFGGPGKRKQTCLRKNCTNLQKVAPTTAGPPPIADGSERPDIRVNIRVREPITAASGVVQPLEPVYSFTDDSSSLKVKLEEKEEELSQKNEQLRHTEQLLQHKFQEVKERSEQVEKYQNQISEQRMSFHKELQKKDEDLQKKDQETARLMEQIKKLENNKDVLKKKSDKWGKWHKTAPDN